ncbi:MAG: hypothetical protein Q9170_006294 [Blastenia crenularia]
MCTWFCETFCCFLLRFHHWLRPWNKYDDLEEHGDSLPLTNRNHNYNHHYDHRGHFSPPNPNLIPPSYPPSSSSSSTQNNKSDIPLAPFHADGSPVSSIRKKHAPPRTVPRAVPLPVRYPPAQTPTGKNFRYKPAPNRMKPLPPLRRTFDGGGKAVQDAMRTMIGVEEPRKGGGDDNAVRAPPPAYFSKGAPRRKPVPPVLVLDGGGGRSDAVLGEGIETAYCVKRQRGRQTEPSDRHRRQHEHGMWASIGMEDRTAAAAD